MAITELYLIGGTALFRHGLRSYLPAEAFRVTNEFETVDECLASVGMAEPEPDIVIVAGGPSDAVTGDAVVKLLGAYPHVRVLVLAETLSLDEFGDCLAGGASGYLLSSIGPEAFGHSITLITLGEKVFASEISRAWAHQGLNISMVAKLPLDDLTNREIDILKCLTVGASNKVIARKLNIAEATVKIHMKSLLRKVGARNRTQAALWAVEAGMVPPAGPETPSAP